MICGVTQARGGGQGVEGLEVGSLDPPRHCNQAAAVSLIVWTVSGEHLEDRSVACVEAIK